MFDNLEKTASRIQLKLSGGLVSDENRYPLTFMKDLVHVARAWYLGEKLKNSMSIPSQYYQSVDCLDIECKEITCDGVGTGSYQYLAKVPELVGGLDRKAFRFVGDVKGKSPFEQMITYNFSAADNFPFLPKRISPKFHLLGDTIELFNLPTPNMKKLKVIGIFSNPTHPMIMGCGKQGRAYPMPADDLKIMEDLIIKDAFYYMQRVKPDVANDAKPNT